MAYRKGAGVIMRNASGKFLLQHRDNNSRTVNPGRIAFFGGGVEPNENPERTVIREIEEELGIKMEKQNLREYRILRGESYTSHIYEYMLPINEENLALREGRGIVALSIEQIHSDERCLPYVRRLLPQN